MHSCSRVQNVHKISLKGGGSISEQGTVWRLSGLHQFFFCFFLSACLVVMFCLRKKDSMYCVVTVCSALPARTPETCLEMEKKAATSAWSSPEHQWLCTVQTEDTGIPCRAWGNRRVRGKLGHDAWVGERIVKELPRQYLTESRGELRQDEAKAEQFQHQRDWTATRSPTKNLTFWQASWFSSGPSSVWSTKMSMSSAKCELCTGVTARALHHQRWVQFL